jgi:flavin reductase (DIM6/NTAB) family NADH-FMN oxidoreductase RutF
VDSVKALKALPPVFQGPRRARRRVRWMRSRGNNPIIAAGVAWLDCAKHEMISAGDHSILLGRVLDFGHSSEAPLGFYQGRYVSLGRDVAPRVRA